MAIFICTLENQSRMEAGIRKDVRDRIIHNLSKKRAIRSTVKFS